MIEEGNNLINKLQYKYLKLLLICNICRDDKLIRKLF